MISLRSDRSSEVRSYEVRTEMYELTDEELELFNSKLRSIGELITGVASHLVTPLLIRATIGSYLDIKGFQPNNETRQLAQDLASNLTNLLITNTNRYLTERN